MGHAPDPRDAYEEATEHGPRSSHDRRSNTSQTAVLR